MFCVTVLCATRVQIVIVTLDSCTIISRGRQYATLHPCLHKYIVFVVNFYSFQVFKLIELKKLMTDRYFYIFKYIILIIF